MTLTVAIPYLDEYHVKGIKSNQQFAKYGKDYEMKKAIKILLLTIIFIMAVLTGIVFVSVKMQEKANEILKDAVHAPNEIIFENGQQDYELWLAGYCMFWKDSIMPFKKSHKDESQAVTWKSESELCRELKLKESSGYHGEDMATDYQGDTMFLVSRPPETTDITLRAELTYKKFWKASKTFTIKLLADEEILKPEDVNAVSLESVESGTYDKNMTIQKDEETGRIVRMYGDFGDICVKSASDAETFVGAYREELGIPEWAELSSDMGTGYFVFGEYERQFHVLLCYGDMEIDGQEIVVTTNDYGEVIEIVPHLNENLEKPSDSITQINIEEKITEAAIEMELVDYQIISQGDDKEHHYGKDTFVIGESCYDDKGNFIQVLRVKPVDDIPYTLYINMATGETEKEQSPSCVIDEDDIGGIGIDGPYQHFADSIFPRNRTYEGKTQDLKPLYFEASNTGKLRDEKRSIHIRPYPETDGGGDGDWTQEELEILREEASEIWRTKKGEFSDHVGTETYVYLQNAYKWYEEQFSYQSYDGKNGTLYAYTMSPRRKDNAFWIPGDNIIEVCKKTKKYYYSYWPEVLAHEYTHGIFHTGFKKGYSDKIAAIDEAYADIFACFIVKDNDWEMFKKDDGTCSRDLKKDVTYDEFKYYENEDNKGQFSHENSVIISNIAYQMQKSGLFTDEELYDIWFWVMKEGIYPDSDFRTVKDNMNFILKVGNFSKQQTEFVDNIFESKNINGSTVILAYNKPIPGDILTYMDKQDFYVLFKGMDERINLSICKKGMGLSREEQEKTADLIEIGINGILSKNGYKKRVSITCQLPLLR